ncbi:MAG: hypothetical protein V4760_09950, partial [Bdellovibrionota bacterium]
ARRRREIARRHDVERGYVVVRMAPEVSVVSRERIRDEIEKLLATSNRVKGLSLLLSTGLLSSALAESAPFVWGEEAEWLERFASIGSRRVSMSTLLALFFFPVWKETGEKDFRDRHLKALKLDNQKSDAIVFSLKMAKDLLAPSKMRRGELALTLRHRDASEALELADVLAATRSSWETEADRSKWIDSVGRQAEKTRDYFLSGDDLKNAGIKPGPWMGALLKEAQMLQLEGSLESREAALTWLIQQPKSSD